MKKKTLIIALLAVVAVMGIGFSILSNHLKIQGTVKVDDSFDVEIVDIKRVNYTEYFSSGIGATSVFDPGEARELAAPTYTATTATFNVSMGLASQITYLITIENKGSISAQIKNVVVNKSEDSDIQVIMPININNRRLFMGEKAYFLVRMTYPYKDDLKGNDSEISVEFDAQQMTDGQTTDFPLYLTVPGSQYSQGVAYPIEIIGMDTHYLGDNNELRYSLYESIDGGDFEMTNSYTLHNGKYEVFNGIEYHPEYEQPPVASSSPEPRLQDGLTHVIKVKLYDSATSQYTNELTLYYNSNNN